ncbi:MAG: hypothetical protein MUF16_18460 [Burkholderiaceae bacterium]|jgi:CRP-like cAMP-binding protein|nr:hypothetical protein [Burkholderiaceae bacterium]
MITRLRMAAARTAQPRMAEPLPDSRWHSPELLARGIGRIAPFKSWPSPALLRLARAESVSSHPPGAMLIARKRPQEVLSFVLERASQVMVTDAGGRRFTFLYDDSAMVCGLAPLFDGDLMLHELIAMDHVCLLRIPFAAVRAEVAAAPALWKAFGAEMYAHDRRSALQMTRFVFDSPRVHMAALLVGLAGKGADRAKRLSAVARPVARRQLRVVRRSRARFASDSVSSASEHSTGATLSARLPVHPRADLLGEQLVHVAVPVDHAGSRGALALDVESVSTVLESFSVGDLEIGSGHRPLASSAVDARVTHRRLRGPAAAAVTAAPGGIAKLCAATLVDPDASGVRVPILASIAVGTAELAIHRDAVGIDIRDFAMLAPIIVRLAPDRARPARARTAATPAVYKLEHGAAPAIHPDAVRVDTPVVATPAVGIAQLALHVDALGVAVSHCTVPARVVLRLAGDGAGPSS